MRRAPASMFAPIHLIQFQNKYQTDLRTKTFLNSGVLKTIFQNIGTFPYMNQYLYTLLKTRKMLTGLKRFC